MSADQRCPDCRTAILANGRIVCQACSAVAAYIARPAAARDYPPPQPSPRAGQPCVLCDEAPSGPGGVLCAGCKARLESQIAR